MAGVRERRPGASRAKSEKQGSQTQAPRIDDRIDDVTHLPFRNHFHSVASTIIASPVKTIPSTKLKRRSTRPESRSRAPQ